MPVNGTWPAHTAERVEEALTAAAKDLSSLDAHVEHYRVPDGGYAAWTGQRGSEAFSLEARLGPAHRNPGHSMWGILQVFDHRQPNLALVRFLERRDSDGLPDTSPGRPHYSVPIDNRLCRMFLPLCNRALNGLDPSKRARSQHVDCFPGRITLGNAFQSPLLAVGLFRRFRADGQNAIILTDFNDPFAVPPVRLVASLVARSDTHLIPRTRQPSTARLLLRAQHGTIQQLGGMSTATDHGIGTARRYLR
ncbi:hypothetical protein [Streptomyces sp. NRRL S-87]|uniref:hypothetical protein n=1 Tax=Streptomyces sp. NRRL S-87 TaxID=1463920 RepID=UPI0004BF5B11|nr:hypothetical protein [Streptomyces sp. NRRL S-87]